MITPNRSKLRKSLVSASETPGPPRAEGGIREGVLFEFRHIRNAGILDAPDLLGVLTRAPHQRGLRIYAPSIDAIDGAGRAQMRQPGPVFYAAEQQGISIGQSNGSCVEDAVDGVGPIISVEDRVAAMADKQWNVDVCRRVCVLRVQQPLATDLAERLDSKRSTHFVEQFVFG